MSYNSEYVHKDPIILVKLLPIILTNILGSMDTPNYHAHIHANLMIYNRNSILCYS